MSLDDYSWIDHDRFDDWQAAQHHLAGIWSCGAPADLLAMLQGRLTEYLHELVDPDAAVANLDRFIAASRSPTSLLSLFERDQEALSALMQVFTTSQALANRLIADPESFDLMRASDGQPAERSFLVDELVAEIEPFESASRAALAIRKFSSREIIRIAYGEFVRDLNPAHVGQQLAYVTDAILEAALAFSLRRLANTMGLPNDTDGKPVRVSLIGLGHLGGSEMAYGDPFEVLFLYQGIESKNDSHQEFLQKLVQEVISLIQTDESSALGVSVDTSFRPLGDQTVIHDSELTAKQLESDGRTWQRMKMTKSRVVAGDAELGSDFIQRLQPWIYQQFMSRQDFTNIRTLQTKLRRRFEVEQADAEDVNLAPGGRADIELMIQFLQLLHGWSCPAVRVGNTFEAIAQLESAGCLTHQESSLLLKGIARLCRLEHQLSIMTGRLVSQLPSDQTRRRRLAWHLGIRNDTGTSGDLDRFQSQLDDTFKLNRKVLNHLMVEAPDGQDDTGNDNQEPEFAVETELVLDPDPDPKLVQSTLQRHGLQDIPRAMEHIHSLATESVRFLSRRRCHHFFAAVAPQLLAEIATTPDPDRTLSTLSEVADSLGGKSSLWELLRSNSATLRLMVRLCAATPYLSDLLIATPGMIDELIDSLLMNRLPSAERWDARSIDLCRRATDIDVVIHGFKNSAHLMIGVHDILGKETVETTHRALADCAEACLRRTIEWEQEQLAMRFGDPVNAQGEPAELIAVALGKFGGREPNYHSDLDVVFLYSDRGETQRRVGGPRKTIPNAQFFNQLAGAVVNRINHSEEFGRLYELDGKLRPAGEEGVIAVEQQQFIQRFRRGLAPLWQRLALCKARVVSGSRFVRANLTEQLQETQVATQFHRSMIDETCQLRLRIQQTASEENLKRGVGGTVDVEMIAQMMTLKHIHEHPSLSVPGTIDSLNRLADLGLLPEAEVRQLIDNYRTLRRVEANLCLMNTKARHELPESEAQLNDLAFLMNRNDPGSIRDQVHQCRVENRQLFQQIFDR